MTEDFDRFDDVDEPKWDLPDIVTPVPLDKLTPDQLKQVCDHRRRMKRMEALKKVALAIIAAIPIIIAMLR